MCIKSGIAPVRIILTRVAQYLILCKEDFPCLNGSVPCMVTFIWVENRCELRKTTFLYLINGTFDLLKWTLSDD